MELLEQQQAIFDENWIHSKGDRETLPAQVNATSFVLPPLVAALANGGTVTITDHEPLLAEYDITRV